MSDFVLLIMGCVALGVWAYHFFMEKTNDAFAAGVKFGRAASKLTPDQVEQIIRDAGLDPKDLKGWNE